MNETEQRKSKPKCEHDWVKSDLVSGVKTRYKCGKCGMKGVRLGVSWPPRTREKSETPQPERTV